MRRDAIFINRESDVPLHRQLETALREAILSGVLRPGERMLSSRELQTHLGVSRNTVTEALNQLDAEGYIVTKRGVGTFVSPEVRQLPKRRLREQPEKLVPSQQALHFIDAQATATDMIGGAAFRPGLPALDSFPLAQFKACFEPADWAAEPIEYPQRSGLPALRNAITTRLRQTRGVACSPEQVLITAGAQAAFSLIFTVLLHDGDAVVIEDPCYPNVLSLLRSYAVRIVPAAVDDAGMNVDEILKVQAKAAYVTPSHQYPTGAVLSLKRRLDLLQWAARRNAWIIEDDFDTEFNYTGHPQPPLQGLDEERRVIYVGTFSKSLSPALRVAYIVVPESLVAVFEAAHEITGAAPSTPIQAALARFIERGHLGRHISKMRKIYDERRRFVSAALANAKGSPFTVRDSASGLHFIAELPASLPDTEVSAKAAQVGVAMPALSEYYIAKPALNGVVIGYAATPIPQARAAIDAVMKQLR